MDESGQDTGGEFFIVSVVVTKENREQVRDFLEKAETQTGKKKTKWNKSKTEYKIAYLEKVLTSKLLKDKIFFTFKQNSRSYKEITLITIASAITSAKDQEAYKASIFIDGLSKSEVNTVSVGLRRIGVHTGKVKGVKDEKETLIRLADAIAGLIRENYENVYYSKTLVKLGTQNKTLIEI